jgi:signal transduction histidine kinase
MLWQDSGSFYIWGGLDLRTLYLAVPLSFSVAILRYQTFKSELRLQLSLASLVAASIFASFGDFAVRAFTPAGTSFVLPPFVVILVLLFGAFSLFQLLQRRSMPRIFRWQSTSYHAVKRFAERMAGQSELFQLPNQIVHALIDKLQLEQAALWLRNHEGFELVAHAHSTASGDAALLITKPAPNLGALASANDLHHLVTHVGEPLRLPENQDGLEALVSLSAISQTQAIGVLALGKRTDEEIFHESDFEIIELIAQHVALLLANAHQVRDLRQVPQRVAEAQENERLRIAQELHDTVQQFLGRLPFQLETSRALITTSPQAADARLQQTLDDAQQAARTVRDIRADLAPMQLQHGLCKPLDDLLSRFASRTALAIQPTLDPTVDAALPLAARHALYRVAQQALDNIEAHAQARSVQVVLRHDEITARVTLCIQDDGRGVEAERLREAEGEGRFGMRSMHARLTALGGSLCVESSAGQGTRIEGWVPAK